MIGFGRRDEVIVLDPIAVARAKEILDRRAAHGPFPLPDGPPDVEAARTRIAEAQADLARLWDRLPDEARERIGLPPKQPPQRYVSFLSSSPDRGRTVADAVHERTRQEGSNRPPRPPEDQNRERFARRRRLGS